MKNKKYLIIPILAVIVAAGFFYFKPVKAIEYVNITCDLDCTILKETEAQYEADRDENMERARLKVLRKMNDKIGDQIFDSPYINASSS